jgi:NAD(P)-dependent dehydrogenase (short-subunit alcohol dehydrogenase family)
MVNNAGVPGVQKLDLLEADFSDFEQVMVVNVLGVMVGTKLAARHISTHGGGSIINTSSIGGVQAGPGVMSHRAAKPAVIHFSKSAAMALAPHDIRVNCIAPGHIPTPLLEASAAQLPEAERVAYVQATRDRMRSMRPLQRDGSGRDVAEVVAFLAADASAYVTGTVLPVDGGAVAGIPAPPQYGGQSR